MICNCIKIYTHGFIIEKVIVKKWILANGYARNQDNWKCIKAHIDSIPYFLFCVHSSYSQRVRIEQQIDEVRGIYFFYNISPGGKKPLQSKIFTGHLRQAQRLCTTIYKNKRQKGSSKIWFIIF